MINRKTLFSLLAFFVFYLLSYAHNPKDLKWHVDALVNSLITNDDLDEEFVQSHLNIGCDENDVRVTQGQTLDDIRSNFCNNPLVKSLESNKGEVIIKFNELHCLFAAIYAKSVSDSLKQASCIIVERDLTRSLFGLCCISQKGKLKEEEIHTAQQQFLSGLIKKSQSELTPNTVILTDPSTVEAVYDYLNAQFGRGSISKEEVGRVLSATNSVLKDKIIQVH